MSKSLCVALLISLLAVSAALAAPASKTITINCGQGQGIQQALAHPAEELILQINGMCQERVFINPITQNIMCGCNMLAGIDTIRT